MKLKEIHRTSTFAWSPLSSLPLLATGTVAGALDASFSNDSQLEIWSPLNKNEFSLGSDGQAGPDGVVTINSRFNRLAWGTHASRSEGILAAGMENGELGLWDPAKIVGHADVSESLILHNTTHTGPVRALDFNPVQVNLLSSGATNGEIYIWDLKDPSKPYSPGARSSKLDDITALAWNARVPHVLGTSSSSGYTVVWDLRAKKEVVALAYGGGAGTTGVAGGAALAIGARRGMSDVAWHPDNATRLVTSSEDDSSPVIMVWDLRNARAPEKILTGHDKGVLSLSWCKQDADLLLSCGKDNRALCWNPQTSEMIGELPSADNWAFQVQWCPPNPNLLATANFDGKISIHSLQSTKESETPATQVASSAQQADGSDLFDQPSSFMSSGQSTLSLKQPPKWLRRPISSSFGFGGQLVSVSNLPSAQGGHQSSSIHLRKVVTESSIVERATRLQAATDNQALGEFSQEKSQESSSGDIDSWKALTSLFQANTRDELITLLGFSKEDVAANVAEAIKRVKSQPAVPAARVQTETGDDVAGSRPYLPVVSFAEPEREPEPLSEPTEGPADPEPSSEPTPSELSASVTSDVTKGLDAESTATEPSLFGDDVAIGTPQGDPNVDFFNSMATAPNALPERVLVPHTNYAADSSVAATVGSRPSSAASDTLKPTTFKFYPNEESEIDRLLTKSLVLGDFESAVSLCLSAERYADAILLAVKGGPELLQRTQTAYFTCQTTSLPYLRLYQSIVTNDLADIVQNADLREWQEIFVILCTFARTDEFSGLAKQLGQRLEFQGKVTKAADPDSASQAKQYRKNATLCYLAAGRLEQVVSIWVEEMKEDESLVREEASEDDKSISLYTAHALALQTFIEKVQVFKSASHYQDADLSIDKSSTEQQNGARSFKLAGLYDRYFEYADLLAAQGMMDEAVKYISQTPGDYKGSKGVDLDFNIARERILRAAGASSKTVASSNLPSAAPAAPQPPAVPPAGNPYAAYTNPYAVPTPATQSTTVRPSPYESMYAPPNGGVPAVATQGPYAPHGGPTAPAQQPYQPYNNSPYTSNHAAPSYTNSPYQTQVPPPQPVAPPPLRAPPKRTDQGWNDTPEVSSRRGTPSGPKPAAAPAAITSPFPNSQPSPMTPSSPYSAASGLPPPPGRQGQPLPPPPRGPSRQGQEGHGAPHNHPGHPGPPPPQSLGQGQPKFIPPPQRGHIPPPGQGGPPVFARPPSAGASGVTYPTRSMSPLVRQGASSPLAQGQPGHQAPRPPMPPQAPPPGPYGPPPGQHQQPRGPGGPPPPQGQPQHLPPPPRGGTAPPPGHPPPGPGAPPPHQMGPPPQMGGAPGQYRGPPGPGQGYAPPPGGVPRPPPPGAGGPPPPGPPQPRSQAPGGGPPTPAAPPPKPAAPQPKYPPGDRTHISESMTPAYNVLSAALNKMKQTTPPHQKRVADDTERRLNALFDALNCDTLSKPVQDQLAVLTQAMAAGNQPAASATHVDMLTKGSRTDDIGLWMSAIKLLIAQM